MKKATALSEVADSEGNIDTAVIVHIITGTAEVKSKPKNVKIPIPSISPRIILSLSIQISS